MAGSISGATVAHRARGIVRLNAAFTTDASGDATVTTIGSAFGIVRAILYDPGAGGTALATGVDINVTDSDTGAVLFTLTDAGTAALYIVPSVNESAQTKTVVAAATTSTDVWKPLYVAGKIKIVVAQGGATKTGGLDFIVDEGLDR